VHHSIAKYYELDKEEVSVLLANGNTRQDLKTTTVAESVENKGVKEPVKAQRKTKKGKKRN
jgi:hypothetical protein